VTVRLAYPTATAPTVEVVLGDVESIPASRARRLYQTVARSVTGEATVYSWGTDRRTFNVRLWPLSDAEASSVEAFYFLAEGAGGVNGQAGRWEFVDSFGLVYPVQFAMEVVDPRAIAPGRWEILVTLAGT